MIADTTYSLADWLRRLRDTAPSVPRVLSAYLTVSQASTQLLAFRECCTEIRATLPAEERDDFELAVQQAERYLTQQLRPGHAGVAVFASGVDDYFYALPLPRPVADEVAWGEQPLLGPLDELLDDCERIAVVLFDKKRARIFSVYLGEIEEQRTIQDDVPGKQATGDWFGLAQSRYARHHEDHVLRHAKHTIRELSALLQEHPFDRLLIGGPDEALAILRQRLPRPLRARLAGTVSLELIASDATVLQAALRAGEEIERREEQAAVEELLEAATSQYAALGPRQVLDALHDRRIHKLFMADTFTGEAGECPTCGRLVPGLAACPLCGTPTRTLGDLSERILELARQQGAAIELVSGPAAALLTVHKGLGAWTRQ